MSILATVMDQLGFVGGSTSIYCSQEVDIEAKGFDQAQTATFHTMGYNGGVLRVAGKDGKPMNVIIDVESARFEREVTKINRNHEQQREVGHTTSQKIHAGPEIYGVELEGKLSVSGSDRDQIVDSAREGFPWDGSIEARFNEAKSDKIEMGQKVKVNGKTFDGPVIVAREAVINGFAILNTGADRGATVSIAAELSQEEFGELQNIEHEITAAQAQIKRLSGDGWSLEDIATAAGRSLSFVQSVNAGEFEAPSNFVSELSAIAINATRPQEDDEMKKEMSDMLAKYGVETVEQLEAVMMMKEKGKGDPLGGQVDAGKAEATIAAAAIDPNAVVDAAKDVADAMILAKVNELHRQSEIENICAQSNNPQFNKGSDENPEFVLLSTHAIANKWNATDTQLKAMHWQLTQNNANAGPAIHDGNRHDGSPEVIEAALCMTAGLSESKAGEFFSEKVMNEAVSKDFRGFKPSSLAHQVMRSANMSVRAGQLDDTYIDTLIKAERRNASVNQQIQASGFTTASFPGILRNVANKTLLVAYRRSPSIIPYVFRSTSSPDFKPSFNYRFEGAGVMEQLGKDGEIKHGKVASNEYTKQLDTFGKLLTWTRQDMINDDLGALGRTMEILGTMAFKARELSAIQFIIDPRPGFWNGTATTANSVVNSFTGNPFGIDGMTNSSQEFMGMTDDDGLPVNIGGGNVLLPSSLAVLGMQIKNDTEIRQDGGSNSRTYSTKNPHAGMFDCEATAWLNNPKVNKDTANRDSDWYRFADPNVSPAFEVTYLNGVETPTVESSEADFNTLGMAFRGFFDFGFGANDSRYAQRNRAA